MRIKSLVFLFVVMTTSLSAQQASTDVSQIVTYSWDDSLDIYKILESRKTVSVIRVSRDYLDRFSICISYEDNIPSCLNCKFDSEDDVIPGSDVYNCTTGLNDTVSVLLHQDAAQINTEWNDSLGIYLTKKVLYYDPKKIAGFELPESVNRFRNEFRHQ